MIVVSDLVLILKYSTLLILVTHVDFKNFDRFKCNFYVLMILEFTKVILIWLNKFHKQKDEKS